MKPFQKKKTNHHLREHVTQKVRESNKMGTLGKYPSHGGELDSFSQGNSRGQLGSPSELQHFRTIAMGGEGSWKFVSVIVLGKAH